MHKIIAQGAEAKLYLEKKREGDEEVTVLVKDRIKKSYRIPELDQKIRLHRTRHEANLISRARRAFFIGG